jgi:DNA invertase Pin-like site-specific DNA recombinase
VHLNRCVETNVTTIPAPCAANNPLNRHGQRPAASAVAARPVEKMFRISRLSGFSLALDPSRGYNPPRYDRNKAQNDRLGSARVSPVGQSLATQLEQLRADGCAKIFREKVTGARADRRELLKLLKAMIPGDAVTVTRIDRLARSTFDLFAIVKQIVDAGGQFRSLARPSADTATSTALDDRCPRRPRRRGARPYPHPHGGRPEPGEARGQHMGRPPKLTPQQQKEARRRRAEGATLKELAKSYNVGRATISKLGAWMA